MHELQEFLREAQDKLAGEYRRISFRATEDPGTAGDEGEENWAAFLRTWLPQSYPIVTKGRVLSVDGEASPQVDVLVLKPSYPPALQDKKMYLAGGVAAAFECKTVLKKAHVDEAVSTAARLQGLAEPGPPRSTRRGTPYEELHGPIIFGLLAHSHSWSSETGAGHVTEALNRGVKESGHPRDVLDVTCVADLGTWDAMRMSYSGPALNVWHVDQLRDEFPGGYASCTVFGPPGETDAFAPVEGSFPNMPLAQLCAYLTSRLAWEDLSMRPIADYFRIAGMFGRASGFVHPWELDTVYSAEVAQALRAGRIDQSPWSKWSLGFG